MSSPNSCKNSLPNCEPGKRAGLQAARPIRLGPAMLDQILVWIARARERRHLARLSDHMLKDIGISRVDAEWESRRRPWQS